MSSPRSSGQPSATRSGRAYSNSKPKSNAPPRVDSVIDFPPFCGSAKVPAVVSLSDLQTAIADLSESPLSGVGQSPSLVSSMLEDNANRWQSLEAIEDENGSPVNATDVDKVPEDATVNGPDLNVGAKSGSFAGSGNPASKSTVSNVNCGKPRWISLFKKKPRIAGDYAPVQFDMNNPTSLPEDVVQAGYQFWSDCLVGFFLSEYPSDIDVYEHVRKVWKLRGGLRVTFVDDMFYLKFSDLEERSRVLESEPSILAGIPFIITSWRPSVDSAREQIFTIPVWAQLTHVPSVLQSLLGLNWLACHIGKLLCFDANTVERKRLTYARALIEITPDKSPPSKIEVVIEGRVVAIDVTYSWKPDICLSCKSFGHTDNSCVRSTFDNILPVPPKIPLPRPPSRRWVPKDKAKAPSPVPTPEAVTVPYLPTPEVDASSVPPCNTRKIIWCPHEKAWHHPPTDMFFDPSAEGFFKYASGNAKETRRLHYIAVENELVLTDIGFLGERNKEVFEDVSWDRRFFYCKDFTGYVPDLVTLFAGYMLLSGPMSSGSQSNCASEGEE